jgi:C4-dicarboxylate-specific signal transduction histidine kinase
MSSVDVMSGGERVDADSLLLSVAEQLKAPLTAIARQAELGQLTGQVELTDAAAIRTQATAALTLVDSYLLGLDLMHRQGRLQLEPVSLSSMITDAAHDLSHFADQYKVQLEVDVQGRYGPVMGNPQGLRAALLSLGFALVEAQAAQDIKGPKRIILAAHRTPHGIVTGVYGQYEKLSAEHWRAALGLAGRARQPFSVLTQGSGAGLFVADVILRSMETQLRVGRYQHQSGLAATFQPSQQLTIV